MKVCTIERVDGSVFFDGTPCCSADNAYMLFRSRYNKALGKATHKMFGHIGQRNERITSVGIDFNDTYHSQLAEEFRDLPKVKCYIIGLLGPSYCRIFGAESFVGDAPASEEDAEKYIDWLLASGMGNTRLYGRKDAIKRISTTKRK